MVPCYYNYVRPQKKSHFTAITQLEQLSCAIKNHNLRSAYQLTFSLQKSRKKSGESVTTTMNKCLAIDLLLLLDKSISQQLSSLMTLSKLPLRHLFESPGLSTPASLSCLRGYFSNMALGTVKGSIPAVSSPPPPITSKNLVFFFVLMANSRWRGGT